MIVMGDHGTHFGPYASTVHGWYEHRNPLMIVLAPKTHLTNAHAQALSKNQEQLVTVFDFYETLKEVPSLSCVQASSQEHTAWHGGRSLFKELPPSRSCADAGVRPHWCVDTIFDRSVQVPEEEQSALIRAVLDELARRTAQVQAQCKTLRHEDFRVVSALVVPQDRQQLGSSLEANIAIENIVIDQHRRCSHLGSSMHLPAAS